MPLGVDDHRARREALLGEDLALAQHRAAGSSRPAQTCTRPCMAVSPRSSSPSAISAMRPFSITETCSTPASRASCGVAREVVDRAVHRNEALRTYQLDHAPLLGAMRVTAHVHAAIGEARTHLAAAPDELAEDGVHLGLVAGDGARGEDDAIAGADVERGMIAARELRERGVRLALRAGRDRRGSSSAAARAPARRATRGRRATADSRSIARRAHACRRRDRAARSCGRCGARCRRAGAADGCSTRTSRRRRRRSRLRPASRARRRRRLSLPVGPSASMFVESLMRSVTPASPSSREALGVEVLAVGRRLVELEVAGVDDHARVGGDGERRRVGDGVRDADGLDVERADVERRARARLEAAARARAPRARRAARG